MISSDKKKITHKLRKKGWKEDYIAKTLEMVKAADKNKHPRVRFLDKILFWISLIVILIGNVFVILGITPVILEMPLSVVIIVVAVVGLCFGFFMDIIIRDLEYSRKYYLLTGLFVPIIASISVFLALELSKLIARELRIILHVNPLLIILFYVLGFSLPHVLFKIGEKKSYLSQKK